MPDPLVRKFRRELNAGTLALVLLAILDQAGDDRYAYQIAGQLETAGAGLFGRGALYPVLRGMSANGLLASRIVPSYAGPPRRYYRITPLGRQMLGEWRKAWTETRELVEAFVGQ